MDRFADKPLRDNPEFQAYHARHLASLEADQEAGRSEAWRTLLQRLAISLALLLVLAAGLFTLFEPYSEFSSWLSFGFMLALLLVLGVWVAYPALDHADITKARVTPLLVAWFGPFRFRSDGEDDVSLDHIADWQILPGWDEIQVGDTVTGRFRGVPVWFAEIELVERRVGAGTGSNTSGSGSSRNRLFKGLLAEYTLPEPVDTLTLVAVKNRHLARRAEQLGWTAIDAGHDNFEAWVAGDAADAQPLPDSLPAILARMAVRLDADQVIAAFEGHRLVILLQGAKNTFEPPLRKAADLFEQAENLRGQLGQMLAPVTELPIGPSQAIDDTPLELDHETLEAEAKDRMIDFGKGGCLPMMVMSTAAFLAYGVILRGADQPGWSLSLALVGSPLLASVAWALLGRRRGKPIPWVSCVIRLAIALGPLVFLLR